MSRRLRDKARRLLSLEKGTVFKEPGGKINVCLLYPNTYHVGMSNLGFQGVYSLLNDRPDVLAERAFLPDEEDMEEHARTETELFSLESGRPVGAFDIVAFSLSFENDYPNVLKMLELSNLPLSPDRRRPLLAAGGICAFSNPEPLAEFFDVFFVGDAEGMLYEFLDLYKAAKGKDELLVDAPGIEGLYVPSLYDVKYGKDGLIEERAALGGAPEMIKRRFTPDISSRLIRPSIVTPETEFSGMYLIEAMRGCPYSCNFCLAGHVYNPPRIKPLDAVRKDIEEALGKTAKAGIIGPSLTEYPHAEEVLKIEGVDFSITSLRASPKSAALVSLMKGRKSVSIAPEAGTERLRRVINKRITEDDILETSRLILSSGIRTLRLYFMVGLPTEGDEDIEGIVNLARVIRANSARGEISITLSAFVPKPSTPFQWHPMERPAAIKERLGFIKKSLAALKGVRVFHDVPKYAHMQGMFSVGDRRVSAALRAMSKEPDWRRASKEAGIDPDFYTLRQKGFEERLPWDFIDSGIPKKRLYETYMKALGEK